MNEDNKIDEALKMVRLETIRGVKKANAIKKVYVIDRSDHVDEFMCKLAHSDLFEEAIVNGIIDSNTLLLTYQDQFNDMLRGYVSSAQVGCGTQCKNISELSSGISGDHEHNTVVALEGIFLETMGVMVNTHTIQETIRGNKYSANVDRLSTAFHEKLAFMEQGFGI